MAFGWKGGIGTSSRVLPASLGGWTVGVLVQTNFGGIFQVLGAPVGKELGQYAFKREAESPGERGDGSCVMVIATDAPLSDRNLQRLAARAIMGLARTGSSASNGSGDYVLAFSTSDKVRRPVNAARLADRGAGERADVGAVRGGGRGDGRGDLQLDVHGDDDDGKRPTRSRRFRSTRSKAILAKYGVEMRRQSIAAQAARFLTYS